MNHLGLIFESSATATFSSILEPYIPHAIWAVAVAIAALVGRYFGLIKLHKEMQKLNGEIIKLQQEAITEAGKTLEKIHHHRRLYDDATRDCSKCLILLMEVMRTPTASRAQLDEARNNFCAIFGHDAIPRFLELVEWEHLSKKSDSRALKIFMESHLAPELARFAKWIKAINLDRFVVEMALSPYQLSIGTVQPFLQTLSGLAPDDRATFEPIINQSITVLRNGQ
jgi:hypothetical protein